MASEANAPRLHPDGLVTVALATFNVTLALLAPLLLLYRRDPGFGETLADLGTGVGLGLFALLWVAATWATRGALGGFPDFLVIPFHGAIARGMLWGGRAGVFVFMALVIAVAATAVVTDATETTPSEFAVGLLQLAIYLIPVTTVGSAVAFVVGAAVGAAATMADFVILLLVRRALRGTNGVRGGVRTPRRYP